MDSLLGTMGGLLLGLVPLFFVVGVFLSFTYFFKMTRWTEGATLRTMVIAATVGALAAIVVNMYLVERRALSSLPYGTVLLLAGDAACPIGWFERANFISTLDGKGNDDYEGQDFHYIEQGGDRNVIRLRSCVRVK